MRHPKTRRLPRRAGSGQRLLVLLAVQAAAGTGAVAQTGTPVPELDPRGFVLPTIFFPTSTRTPTPINVGNFVWDDFDGDGRQDAGEPGMSGVTVQLWNSAKNDLLDTDTTDANGIYTLIAPTPGNYRVRALLPSPALDEFSPKDQAGGDDNDDSDINPVDTNFGFTDIYVFGNNLISITSIDIGILKFRTPTATRTPTPINIGNFVWNDLNENGVQDAGEPGLVGIQVQLWNSAKSDMIDTAFTNASGIYTVTAPVPGNYRVRVLPPGGAGISPLDAGESNNTDNDFNPSGPDAGFTDIFSIANNVISITNIDAGLINVPATPTPTRTPTATRTPTSPPLATLDIDADGEVTPLIDGLLALRYRFSFTGNTLVIGAVDGDCTRCSANAIEGYLDGLGMILDIDGDEILSPFTDGLLVIRYLFGLTGSALTNNTVGGDCTRCSASDISNYLDGLD